MIQVLSWTTTIVLCFNSSIHLIIIVCLWYFYPHTSSYCNLLCLLTALLVNDTCSHFVNCSVKNPKTWGWLPTTTGACQTLEGSSRQRLCSTHNLQVAFLSTVNGLAYPGMAEGVWICREWIRILVCSLDAFI